MKKEHLILASILGVAVGGALVYGIIWTLQSQHATQQQLNDLQQQIKNQQTAATAPLSPTAPGPSVISLDSPSTQAGTMLAKERATHEVITEGFRLLDTHLPANAEKAIIIFREGIEKIDDKNTNFYHGLGRSLLVAQHYPEAVEAFQSGLKLDSKNAELASGLGWAYWDLKDYYHAKLSWEQAIANDPKSLDAWSIMSWVYLGLAQRDKAIKGFDVLLASRGGKENTQWNNGMTMARASNFQLNQIRSQFPLPDPALFTAPPASAPASAPH